MRRAFRKRPASLGISLIAAAASGARVQGRAEICRRSAQSDASPRQDQPDRLASPQLHGPNLRCDVTVPPVRP